MFITDTRAGEKPILAAGNTDDLLFKDEDGVVLAKVDTQTPWSHEKSSNLALEDILGSDYYSQVIDAFIGNIWVGSTQI